MSQQSPRQSRPWRSSQTRHPRQTQSAFSASQGPEPEETATDAQPTTDWGVGRRAPRTHRVWRQEHSWPQGTRSLRLGGVAAAIVGVLIATHAAMNLAHAAREGHPLMPPWLVAVLAGAGLVAAAGYVAWAGASRVRDEEQRWAPTILDSAAGLTQGDVLARDPYGAYGERGADVPMVSQARPIMGTSTVDTMSCAPAGVAGAVGGFFLCASLVCAILAMVLPTVLWLACSALSGGVGIVCIAVAHSWLTRVH